MYVGSKMAHMAKKAPKQRTQPFQIRLHPAIRTQLEELVKRNYSSLSAEVVAAIKAYLAANELWPPPPTP